MGIYVLCGHGIDAIFSDMECEIMHTVPKLHGEACHIVYSHSNILERYSTNPVLVLIQI